MWGCLERIGDAHRVVPTIVRRFTPPRLGRKIALSMRIAFVGLSVLLVTLDALSASAQERPVLVLPLAIGEADPAVEAARAEQVIARFPGGAVGALALDVARRRYEESGSAEPPSVTEADIERWLMLSRQAVRHLAHAEYAAARETLSEAQSFSDRAAEELNRELARARQALDTCLYDVRALLETHDLRAEPRAMECRRLVPRIEPSRFSHTPEVVGLLARIDQLLAEAPPGRLQIESEPSGCAVRLNGIEFGRTPFVSEGLAPGEYRAQIECDAGRRGRVHRIRVGPGTTLVRVDTRFDGVVRTDTALRLVYPDAVAAARRAADAARIAEVVGASEIWLVSGRPDGVIQMDRLERSGRLVASVRAREASLGGAIAALAAGRSEDWTSGAPVALPRAEGQEEVHSGSRVPGDRTGEIVAGAAMGIAAIGGWVAAFGLYDWRLAAGARLAVVEPSDPEYLPRQQTWLDGRWAIYGASWASAALGTAALPLVLPPEDGVPIWSWLVAAAGGIPLAIGIAEIALASPCDRAVRQDAACVQRAAPIDRGVIVSSMAAPLLAVPVVYLMRELTRSPGASAAIEIGPGRAEVRVGGAFE